MPLPSRFPKPIFADWLLRRALLYWIGGRIMLLLVMRGAVALGPVSILIAAVVAAVAMVEARQRGELLLLADVGVSPGTAGAVSLIPPLLGEAALTLAFLALVGGE